MINKLLVQCFIGSLLFCAGNSESFAVHRGHEFNTIFNATVSTTAAMSVLRASHSRNDTFNNTNLSFSPQLWENSRNMTHSNQTQSYRNSSMASSDYLLRNSTKSTRAQQLHHKGIRTRRSKHSSFASPQSESMNGTNRSSDTSQKHKTTRFKQSFPGNVTHFETETHSQTFHSGFQASRANSTSPTGTRSKRSFTDFPLISSKGGRSGKRDNLIEDSLIKTGHSGFNSSLSGTHSITPLSQQQIRYLGRECVVDRTKCFLRDGSTGSSKDPNCFSYEMQCRDAMECGGRIAERFTTGRVYASHVHHMDNFSKSSAHCPPWYMRGKFGPNINVAGECKQNAWNIIEFSSQAGGSNSTQCGLQIGRFTYTARSEGSPMFETICRSNGQVSHSQIPYRSVRSLIDQINDSHHLISRINCPNWIVQSFAQPSDRVDCYSIPPHLTTTFQYILADQGDQFEIHMHFDPRTIPVAMQTTYAEEVRNDLGPITGIDGFNRLHVVPIQVVKGLAPGTPPTAWILAQAGRTASNSFSPSTVRSMNMWLNDPLFVGAYPGVGTHEALHGVLSPGSAPAGTFQNGHFIGPKSVKAYSRALPFPNQVHFEQGSGLTPFMPSYVAGRFHPAIYCVLGEWGYGIKKGFCPADKT